jgi:hypothetical protein
LYIYTHYTYTNQWNYESKCFCLGFLISSMWCLYNVKYTKWFSFSSSIIWCIGIEHYTKHYKLLIKNPKQKQILS